MSHRVKIFMIDDHPLVKQGVEAVIRLEEDLELIGHTSGIKEALEVIKEELPDIALVDLRLQGEHGLDLVKKGRQINDNTRYIILTSYATEEEIRRAMEEEVEGYILKEALPEELITAIRTVSRGRKYYDPAVVQYAMAQSQNTKKTDLEELTPREREVLKSLAKGLSNRSIASKMVISEHTVKKHVGQILEKLQLIDRTQAALYAVSKGLHTDDLAE